MLKQLFRTFDRRVTKGRLFLLRRGIIGRRYRDMRRMSQNPIFIGGCGRSGTSLLLSLLSVFPNIYAIPYETKAFCTSGYAANPNPENEFRMDYIYSHLIKADLPIGVFGRWCEKTPKNIKFVERILNYFGGGVRFIHIVRDGRDVITSHHPKNHNRYWVSPERWVEDVRAGRKAEDSRQVATIRYEDLTSDPLSTLCRLCHFLGEPFEEERLLAYPESAQFGTGDFFQDVTRDDLENEMIHTRSVRRWEKKEHSPVVERLLRLDGATELLRHYEYLDPTGT